MDKVNKGKYSIQIILTCMGAAGIMGILLSSAQLSAAEWIVYIAAILSAVFWVICMNKKPQGRKIMAAAGILLLLVAVFLGKMLYTGIILIINDIIALFQETGRNTFVPIQLHAVYTDTEVAIAQSVVLIFFAILISFVVSLIVVYVRSMGCAIISILPFILIFMAYNIVPGTFPLLMCIVYVLGVAALKRKGNDYYSAKLVVIITLICAAVCFIIVSPFKYKSFAIFNVNWANVGIMLQQNVLDPMGLGFIGEMFAENSDDAASKGNTSGGLTNSGRLGDLDFIEYENEDVLKVYTLHTGKTQYFPQFYGSKYLYKSNRWNKYVSNDKDTQIKQEILAMIEYNQELKDYIDDGTGNYEDMVKTYQYTIVKEFLGFSDTNEYYGFQVDEECYKKLKAIADKEKLFNVLQFSSSGKSSYNQDTYSAMENKYRAEAYEKFLDISDEHRALVHELIGKTDVTNYQNKIYYIGMVKRFLQNNCTYTLSPGRIPEDKDFLEYFLKEHREGYCTYFATAATVMFRAAGIPARYVEGYVVTPEQIKESESYRAQDIAYKEIAPYAPIRHVDRYIVNIQDNQAHAWVEIYMDGFGWIPVEVTPPYVQDGIFGTGNQSGGSGDMPPSEDETESLEEETQKETVSVEQESEHASEKETDTVGIGSGTVDLSEWFDSIKKFIDKNIEKIIIWSVGFLVVIISITLGLHRYSKKKKQREAIFTSGDVIQLYSHLEKLLSYTPYKQPDSMAYEYFADYMEHENEVFKASNFKKMTNIVLKARFGGKNVVISEAEETVVRNGVIAIRESVLENMPLKLRIWIKYFVIL